MKLRIATMVLHHEEFTRRLIRDTLSDAGVTDYEIFSAKKDFMEQLHEDVHIAVIDHNLDQEYTGLDVLDALLDQNPHCTVILLTGDTDSDLTDEYVNHGVAKIVRTNKAGFLAKLSTFMKQILLDVVEDVLFYSQLREKNTVPDVATAAV